MFTLVKFDGTVISEHLNRQAAYNAMMDMLDRKIPCHIEYTAGQSPELVKACRQLRVTKVYSDTAFDNLSKRTKEEMRGVTIERDGHSISFGVNALTKDGHIKKSFIKKIEEHFRKISQPVTA